jgi:hypothetical protein
MLQRNLAILTQAAMAFLATGLLAQAPTPTAGSAGQPAALATPGAPATPAGPAPKLVVAEPVIDAGQVSKGEKVQADFVIENQGAADLEISDARPACGCTVASFDKRVPPGGKGKIHAVLDTIDFQGPVAKTITVVSNDPVNPRLTLTIKAKIQPHVAVTPGYARYIYVQTLEPGMVPQTLWAIDHDDFQVLDVQSPYPFITTTLREAKPDERKPEGVGRQWRIEMTIQPDAAVGPLREFLVVTTNHPKQKEVRIPISGFVRPLMHATPQVADFGTVAGATEPRQIELTLVNFGEDAIQIQGIESDTPGVEGTSEATEAGRRFRILLTLKPDAAKGALAGKVKVKTSSAKMPVYEIPVKGTVS